MKRIALATMFLAGLAFSASAQSRWSASAVSATPQFRPDGTQKMQTWDPGANGKGMRLVDNYIGQSYAYLAVTAPQGSTFKFLSLRADDNSINGSVRVEFFRQPRDANPGNSALIASVTSNDSGFQFVTSPAFAAETIDMNRFSYYVRLTLKRNVSMGLPIAYDVSLSQ